MKKICKHGPHFTQGVHQYQSHKDDPAENLPCWGPPGAWRGCAEGTGTRSGGAVLCCSLGCVRSVKGRHSIPEYIQTPRTCELQEIKTIKLKTRRKTKRSARTSPLKNGNISTCPTPVAEDHKNAHMRKTFEMNILAGFTFGRLKACLLVIRFPVCRQESTV